MIEIEEISPENIQEFWALHYKYLVDDGIVTDEEDKAYFAGEDEYGMKLLEKGKCGIIEEQNAERQGRT